MFNVPMVGGHTHSDANLPSLSVAVLGRAKRLLRGYRAKAGDELILAIDLDGASGCKSVKSWDADSQKSPRQIVYRRAALPYIAEARLSETARDISNAGILGTTAILIENSSQGASIDIDRIPRVDSIGLSDWLLTFFSYGFILSVEPPKRERVLEVFRKRGISAEVIGEVNNRKKITINHQGEEAILFDFEKEHITGFSSETW